MCEKYNPNFSSSQVVYFESNATEHQPLDIKEYAKYALLNGSTEEKREVVKAFGSLLYLHRQIVCSSPIISAFKQAQ